MLFTVKICNGVTKALEIIVKRIFCDAVSIEQGGEYQKRFRELDSK